jgi:HK97 family phage major capsid protein
MWIELLQDAGGLKAGFHDIPDETVARSYITAKLAKEAGDGPDKIILERSLGALRTELSTMTRKIADDISDVAQSIHKRGIRIEAGEQEADRTKGLGDFVRNSIIATDGQAEPERRQFAHERLTKVYATSRGQAEGQGATGGFLTPALYESQILEETAEDSIFAPNAHVVPLGARTIYWPALDQYKTPSAGQSAFFGGVQVFRKGEITQRTYTQANFKGVALNAHDLTAFTAISRDEIYDASIPIDSKVAELIGGAINWREEWECFNGTGSGQLLGVHVAPSTINVTRNTGSSILYIDIITMRSRMLPACKKRARWIIHPFTMPYLEQIQDPSGRYVMRPYPIAGNSGTLTDAPIYQMEGIPIYETEKAPLPGTPGDVLLADPTKYLLGRRSGLEIGTSTEFLFDTDQVAIRAKLRNDGQPQLIKPITLADGTAQVSCNVRLN